MQRASQALNKNKSGGQAENRVFKSFQRFLRWLAVPRYERRQPAYSAADYARQRRLGYPFLRFTDGLEREYRDSALTVNAMRLRFSLTFGVLAIISFVFLDQRFGMGLQPGPVMAVLLGFGVPALIVPGLLSLSTRMRPHLYRVLFWGNIILGVSMVTAVVLGKKANSWFPYESVLLVSFYVYGIGLLMVHASLCGALFFLLYVGLVWWLGLEEPVVLLYQAFYLATANGMGILTRYMYEYQDRLAFLMQRELSLHAQQDALTSLLNRRAFRRAAAVTWAQAGRDAKAVGVALFDLDGFKQINDEYGHLAGDEALIKASSILNSHLRRPLDAVGRFGGDELVAIWYDVEPEWVRHTLNQIVAQFAQAKVAGVVGIKSSIGALVDVPAGGQRFDEALKKADELMYEVKRAGGGRVRFEDLERKSRTA